MTQRRAKFIELAEKRVVRALNDIRLIGNLSNRSAYEFSDEDVKKIFRTLQKELDQARSRYSGGTADREFDFKL